VARFIALLFLSLQLMTNTELCQLVKIPVLISHYEEHKALNGDISIFSFLQLHYFNGSPHDNTDMELPFKTTSVAMVIQNCPSAPVPAITAIPPANTQEVQLDFNDFYSTFIPCGCNKDIFQPPQFS
jgi:hypothetical protein